MQTLIIKRGKVVIEDYHHITTIDENLKWTKLTHLMSILFSKPHGRFCASTIYFKILNSLLNVQAREKYYVSIIYTLYTNTSNNVPFYTHVSLYAV